MNQHTREERLARTKDMEASKWRQSLKFCQEAGNNQRMATQLAEGCQRDQSHMDSKSVSRFARRRPSLVALSLGCQKEIASQSKSRSSLSILKTFLVVNLVACIISAQLITLVECDSAKNQSSKSGKTVTKDPMMTSPSLVQNIPYYAPSETPTSPFSYTGEEEDDNVDENLYKKTSGSPKTRDDNSISDSSDERMAVKHKFTFTVNGKQLNLEPPATVTTKTTSTTTTTKVSQTNKTLEAQESERQVRNRREDGNAEPGATTKRLGEYANQSTDDDFGFEVNSGDNLQAAGNDVPSVGDGASTGGHKQRFGGPNQISAASSSSSALMQPSRFSGGNSGGGGGDDEDYGNNTTQSAASSQRTQRKGNTSDDGNSKIISDWPKSTSASRKEQQVLQPQQGQRVYSTDRHSTTASSTNPASKQQTRSGNSVNNQNNSRYSTLLSGESASLALSSSRQGEKAHHHQQQRSPTTTTAKTVDSRPVDGRSASATFAGSSGQIGNNTNKFVSQLQPSSGAKQTSNAHQPPSGLYSYNHNRDSPSGSSATASSGRASGSAQQVASLINNRNGGVKIAATTGGGQSLRAPVYAKTRYAAASIAAPRNQNQYSQQQQSLPTPRQEAKVGKLSDWETLDADAELTNMIGSQQEGTGKKERQQVSSAIKLIGRAAPSVAAARRLPLNEANATSASTLHSSYASGDVSEEDNDYNNNDKFEQLPESITTEYQVNNYATMQHLHRSIGDRDQTPARPSAREEVRPGSRMSKSHNPSNNTLSFSTSTSNSSPKVESVGKKGAKNQRDLTLKLNPYLNATGATTSAAKSRNSEVGANIRNLMSGQQQPNAQERMMSSIVRTGPIHLPNPIASLASSQSAQLRALVPAAMALLAQAQNDPQSRAGGHLRTLLANINGNQQQHYLTSAGQTMISPVMASATQADQQQVISPTKSFVSLTSPSSSVVLPTSTVNGANPTMDHMMATANQLGVSHLTPNSMVAEANSMNMNSYNSLVNSLQDYPERHPFSSTALDSSGGMDQSSGSGMMGVDERERMANGMDGYQGNEQGGGGYGDPTGGRGSGANGVAPGDMKTMSSSSPGSGTSSSSQGSGGSTSGGQHDSQQQQNARSSLSDLYMKAEHKSGDSGPGGSGSATTSQLRTSMDGFEDMPGGLATSEYERDLADLDEEFNRHTGFRSRPSSGSLMSDSLLSFSPERYEPTTRYSRRPTYSDYPGDFLSAAAGSMSSILPRPYPKSAWAGDSGELWADSSVDYSPLASLMSPHAHHYGYPRAAHHYRPTARYQRLAAYPHYAMATSASEQQLQPAPTNYILHPSQYAQAAATMAAPTESISFTLSPLAAAAAAAATALAAADKSRHQNHAWLTLPRLAASTLAATGQATAVGAAPTATGAAMGPATAATLQTASYLQRPPGSHPYLLSSMPIYAIAAGPPARHPSGAPIATAASGATPSYIPYFAGAHPAAGPATIIAYRPAGHMLPSAPHLLTAASFAYPLRMPMATAATAPMTAVAAHHGHTHLQRPTGFSLSSPLRSAFGSGGSSSGSGSGSGGTGGKTIYADLQFAETKPKSNLNGNSLDGSTKSSGFVKVGSITAMARNLTKKMFGSASQMRPQHVAPPANYNAALEAITSAISSQSSSAAAAAAAKAA